MGTLDLTIIGKKFGRLTVLKEHRRRPTNRTTQWKCECECGREVWVDRPKLLSGKTTSCGCLNRTLNGLSSHPLYKTWWGIKERCYKQEYNNSYHNYGGRGIQMCEEWEDFMNFYNWAMANSYEEGLTIDRIDEDGDYSPINCQWLTLSENVARSNKTTPRRILPFMYYGISPEGVRYEFGNANSFAREHQLNANALRRVARGERNHYKEWQFGFTDKPNEDRR